MEYDSYSSSQCIIFHETNLHPLEIEIKDINKIYIL